MTIDERIQKLMDLLAQVKLDAASPEASSAPPEDSEQEPREDDASLFDPEMTVVDNHPVPPGPAATGISASPECDRQESRSRLIAAEPFASEDEAAGDTKAELDETQEMLAHPSSTGEMMALRRAESGVELDAKEPLDFDSDTDAGSGGSIDDNSGAPASSRRPVLPDDVAPALPDESWDDISEDDGPAESGPHFAVTPLDLEDSDVTGVRTHGQAIASFVGERKALSATTFGELVDASLEL